MSFYRNTAKALRRFVKRSHVLDLEMILLKIQAKENILRQKPSFLNLYLMKSNQSWSELIWLWYDIEPKHRQILHVDISLERTMLTEPFYCIFDRSIWQASYSTDGGTWYPFSSSF